MDHVLKVPTPQHGHVTTAWEPGTASEEHVRNVFNELVHTNQMGAVEIGTDGVETWTREFHPDAKVVTLVSPLAGG